MAKVVIKKTETIGIPTLSDRMAHDHRLTKIKTKEFINDLRDTIVQEILDGNRVNLFGLGTFEVRITKEKMGRNPKTGEKIKIPVGRKVVFKAAKGLKNQM